MSDFDDRGRIDLRTSVPAIDLLAQRRRPRSGGFPGSWSWICGERMYLLAHSPDTRHMRIRDELDSNADISYAIWPPYDDESLWRWADELCGLLGEFCENDAVSGWLLSTDEGHVVSYWIRASGGVVNSDFHPRPESLREALGYRSIELFERLGIEYRMRPMGNIP